MRDHPQRAGPIRLKVDVAGTFNFVQIIMDGGQRTKADQIAELPDGRRITFGGGVIKYCGINLSLAAVHKNTPLDANWCSRCIISNRCLVVK